MVTTTSTTGEPMDSTYSSKNTIEEPLPMDDSEAVALLQLLNGAPDRPRSPSPASSCDTTSNIPNEPLDTPRASDSDRSMPSPSPSLRRRGMRKRKPCARFDGTEEENLPLDSPPSMPRRPTTVRKLSVLPRSHPDLPSVEGGESAATLLERSAPANRSPATKRATSSSPSIKPSSSSSSSSAAASSGSSYNKYCHFCQHVKVKHTTSMYACANMDCQRRYCEYCLRIHLAETSQSMRQSPAGGEGWACPHCRKACCCTHGTCKAAHRHCKAYRYRLLRASQAGMRMAARAGGRVKSVKSVESEKRAQDAHAEKRAGEEGRGAGAPAKVVKQEQEEEERGEVWRKGGKEEREEREEEEGSRGGKGSVAAVLNAEDHVLVALPRLTPARLG